MICPSCDVPAVEGQRFCRSCGTVLVTALDLAPGSYSTPAAECPTCDAAVASGQRYCRSCGASVAGDSRPRQPAAPRPRQPATAPAAEPPTTVNAMLSSVAPSRRRLPLSLGVIALILLAGGGAATALVLTNNGDSAVQRRPTDAAVVDATTKPRPDATPSTDTADAQGERATSVRPTTTGATTTTTATTTAATTRSAPPTPPVSSPTAPEAALRRHFEAIDSADFDAAYDLFSTAPGGSSRSTWTTETQGFAPNISVNTVKEISRSGDLARVRLSFYTRDTGSDSRGTPPGKCRWFHGTAYVLDRGGRWRYEPASAGRTSLEKQDLPRSDARCAPLFA